MNDNLDVFRSAFGDFEDPTPPVEETFSKFLTLVHEQMECLDGGIPDLCLLTYDNVHGVSILSPAQGDRLLWMLAHAQKFVLEYEEDDSED